MVRWTLFLLATTRLALAGPLEELGQFERQSADAALLELKLEVDLAPYGKRIGRIIVKNFEVFDANDGAFLQWFNLFHRTTVEEVIDQEILLRPGDLWNSARRDESLRNLRGSHYSNVLVILPVKALDPVQVDLLVVTRDVWSLRLNSNIQFQGDTLTLLSLSIAENNFLGWRKQVELTFTLDQGSMEIGPHYIDKNIGGTHLWIESKASALFGRESGEPEGSRSFTSLEYPLWALSQRFGGEIEIAHYDSVIRQFQGNDLRTYDAPATTADDALPWEYNYTLVQGGLRGKVALGSTVKHTMSLSYEAYYADSRTTDDFTAEGAVARQFRRAILPRSEVSSGFAANYGLHTPVYATYRDFGTYDLREDYLMGPSLAFNVLQTFEALGSDKTYTKLSTTAQAAFSPGGSYLLAWASWGARLQSETILDHYGSVGIYAATPMLGRAVRIVVRSDLAAWLSGETVGNYSLGGDSGLRAHAVGELAGPVRLRVNTEVRSIPWRIWAFRLGGVVFWDMGGTAEEVKSLDPVHDVGVGIRILIPQFNTYVFRVDWAFATEGNSAAWPGRVSLGFLQAF